MAAFCIFVSSQPLCTCVFSVSSHFDWSFLLDSILLQYSPWGFSGMFLDGWHLSWSPVCKTQLCISQDCVLSFIVEIFFFQLVFYRKFLSNNNYLPLSLPNCTYFSSDDLANFLCPVLGGTDCLLGDIMILGYPEDTHSVSKEWDGTQQKQLKLRVSGSWEGGWETNRKETTQIPKLTNFLKLEIFSP